MTLAEAKNAVKYRVPVQICGVTAKLLYGKIRYQRILRISLNFDDHSKAYYTADLVDGTKSMTVCGIEDVEVADDVSDILRSKVYPPAEEGANDGSNLV